MSAQGPEVLQTALGPLTVEFKLPATGQTIVHRCRTPDRRVVAVKVALPHAAQRVRGEVRTTMETFPKAAPTW